ncbi:hypothetical protein SG34_010400 [Thalassomonas viridans]|uniref:Uncharacterized protein n=1 Tax=Thalassomonas viridans TaxID=137584 RepID=A0AAE9Z5R5_9GAMM|nr:hypothetical protein [Thalassomonas viridans]WDE07256.1 hypothetical protein SG34_010400 [Thalassomonas viridans]
MTRVLKILAALAIRIFIGIPLFVVALAGKAAEAALDYTNKQLFKLNPNHRGTGNVR